MDTMRQICLSAGVAIMFGLLGCGSKKVEVEINDAEVWISGGKPSVENFEEGFDKRGYFFVVGHAWNKNLSFEQLRVAALANCAREVSTFLIENVETSAGQYGDKSISQSAIGNISFWMERYSVSDKNKGEHSIKCEVRFGGENIVSVRESARERTSDTAIDCTDDYHVHVKEGLTFQKFLDLLKDNGLPVKILAERLEIWGKVTEGIAELLKDDSVAVEKKAEKVLLEKDAEVNLACYAIIDVSKLKQKEGK